MAITVRILPMSSEEFQGQSHEKVQSQYFLGELPSRQGGQYYFRTKGLDANKGDIVLFQYEKKIIARADYVRRERFDIPVGPYHGALYFDICSIRVFDPVGPEGLLNVWPNEFAGFSNVMAPLDSQFLPKFEQQLTSIRAPSLDGLKQHVDALVHEAFQRSSEERRLRISNASRIPKVITVIAKVYDRNADVIAEVLKRAAGVCEECKCPAPFIRQSDGTPYLEVHHKQRLADGGEDTIENAVAICPNCHRRAHYG